MSSEVALPRPVATAIIATLLGVAAAAWLVTAQQAASMAAMGGIAMVGGGLFLGTWVVMTVAMMFPAVAPIVLTHAGVVRSRGEATMGTVVLVVGYLVVWTAAGLVLLGVIQLLGSSIAAPVESWLPRLGGAIVVLAGIYQLTPLNNACLRACRSPLGFILSHDFGVGTSAAARTGLLHGLECVGSCGALMAVLAVLGLMNLALMAVVAVVFLLEKTWRHGIMLSHVAGAASVILGLTVIIRPDILHLL
jgi:predicted metal-binding membrane protein